MFNPFSTGCSSQCKCHKQQYRAMFGLCTNLNFGIEKQSGPWRKQSQWRQQEGRTQTWDNKRLRSELETSEWSAAEKQKTGCLNRAKGQESDWKITQSDDRCFFFFISINHMNKSMNKLMVYIFIFIYLKCNMVQKYRRSAAPRYIYKINTPFRQNKLPQKKSDITGIKRKKARIHKD